MAKKLHKVDVDVKLLHSSQDSEHGEFLIQEKNKAKHHEDTTIDDVDMILSNGMRQFQLLHFSTSLLFALMQSRKSRRSSSVVHSHSTFSLTVICPSSKWAIHSRGFCLRAPDLTAKSQISCAWYVHARARLFANFFQATVFFSLFRISSGRRKSRV